MAEQFLTLMKNKADPKTLRESMYCCFEENRPTRPDRFTRSTNIAYNKMWNTGSSDMLKKTIEEYCWEAMEQLLKEKPYNKITVRDIAQRVGISTVTFYKHFNSKSDVYYWRVYESGKEYYSKLNDDYTWYNYLYDNLLNNLAIKHETTNMAIYAEGSESILEITFRSNIDLMSGYITRKYGSEVLTQEVQTAIRVYLYGLIMYLQEDIHSGMAADRKQIAEYLTNCIPDVLKKFIPH